MGETLARGEARGLRRPQQRRRSPQRPGAPPGRWQRRLERETTNPYDPFATPSCAAVRPFCPGSPPRSSPRCHAFAAAADRPNVVIIFIDDLGYADIGPFGATKQKTPNLDRMAAEGMKLTSFYAAPVCSVSRAQLLTGCYGARVSVPGVYFPAGPQGLNPKEFTIAERLKELGYATQCVGKWHLGDQPEFLPTKQGFDHYFGIPYSNDMQRKSKETGERVVPLLRDDKVAELLTDEQQSRIVERYTDGGRRVHPREQGQAVLPVPAAHRGPHADPRRARSSAGSPPTGGSATGSRRWTGASARCSTRSRELKLAEQTLVIFTSDNGPWLDQGRGRRQREAAARRQGEHLGGRRARADHRLVAGQDRRRRARATPSPGRSTCCRRCVAVAGGKVPAEPVIDGRDLSPVLFGKSKESPREAHYYFAGYNLQAVRQGPWKLAIAPQTDAATRPPRKRRRRTRGCTTSTPTSARRRTSPTSTRRSWRSSRRSPRR